MADAEFQASSRRRNFLRYLVEEALAGNGSRIKAYSIATTVFGRDTDFDPQVDPIVRIEAMRLRRDLEQYYLTGGREDSLRITIPKGGYIPTFERHAATDLVAEPDTVPVEPAKRSGRLAIRGGATSTAVALVGLLVLGIIVAIWWIDRFSPDAAHSSAFLNERPRVFVTPFASEDADGQNRLIATGITEQLVTNLSRFLGLRVIWVGTSNSTPGIDPKSKDYLLAGSVRPIGGRIRVTVQLLERHTATVIWANNFDHALRPAEIFELQDEIAGRVAATIGNEHGIIARQGIAAARRKPPDSLTSYECVLRAHAMQRSGTVAMHASVRDCLEKVVALEPGYGEAWAMLSWMYGHEYRLGFNPRPELYDAREKSMESALRAVETAPRDPLARLALAMANFDVRNMEKYKAESQAAIQLNPYNPIVLGIIGIRDALSGDWNRGLALLRQSMTLSLDYPSSHHLVFSIYYYGQKDYLRALEEVQRTNLPGFFWQLALEAMALAQLGRDKDAKLAIARLLTLKPDIAEKFREQVGMWQVPGPLVDAMADGLRRGGLPVR